MKVYIIIKIIKIFQPLIFLSLNSHVYNLANRLRTCVICFVSSGTVFRGSWECSTPFGEDFLSSGEFLACQKDSSKDTPINRRHFRGRNLKISPGGLSDLSLSLSRLGETRLVLLFSAGVCWVTGTLCGDKVSQYINLQRVIAEQAVFLPTIITLETGHRVIAGIAISSTYTSDF